jgi:hypothetical protein
MSRSQRPHPRAYLRHQRRRFLLRRWRQLRIRSPWVPPGSIVDLSPEDELNFWHFVNQPWYCRCERCWNARRYEHAQSRQEDCADMALWEGLLELDLDRLQPHGRFRSKPSLDRQLHRIRHRTRDVLEHGGDGQGNA